MSVGLCCQVNPSDIVPYQEPLTTFLFIGMRFQAMASRAEIGSGGAVGGEKALGMARGLAVAHRTLSLSGRLMRIFGPIVQSFVPPMLDAHQDLPLSCAIAGAFIGDDHTWNVLTALQ